jgi:hypothetical protein
MAVAAVCIKILEERGRMSTILFMGFLGLNHPASETETSN